MSDEGKSIKILLWVLIALGTIVGAAYKFFQESTVDNFLYMSIIGVISCITIGVLFFSIYLFVGRYYLKQKVILMYLLLFISVLLYFVSLYLDVQLPTIVEILDTIILTIIFLFIIIIIAKVLRYIIKHKFKELDKALIFIFDTKNDSNTNDKITFLKIGVFLIFFIICLIFWWNLFNSLLSWSYFQGNIMIDMDNIYYKKVTLIPVIVQIMGPNTNLSVVFKGDSNNRFHEARLSEKYITFTKFS